MSDKILAFIKKVQSISQIGLTYSTDPYAVDNYEELKRLSVKMLEEYTDIEPKSYDLYVDFKYPTPQPAVRAMVIQDEKLLLVKEKDSKAWSLPGGWCDVGATPKQTAAKETEEESGYLVDVTKMLAIFDRHNYYQEPLYDVYSMFFLANVIGGEARCNHETDEVGWFKIDDLPELSRKNTIEEIQIAYNVYLNNLETYFE